ncbi:aldo/keto reductase [Bacillus pseudomycoides]|uniref:aldo/keto reductase n=1 Tax=Bacillus pseudomycoides TaxID=64104 RepID=UPI000504EA35|nr:aldo/keto reductase [Bacillus pseudomycoides]KFN14366.1 aldo/keto reductase family protein [Bacillus pseudomycoides]MDR4189521.1 aldo/keto reductase [Bacillus pseudomycoides]MED0857364.1 aldo/keto reductase [Bacillus pseudomycoides]MED1623640.1 aldo/keto reductase [Bacillus pseudomycoides]PEP81668.1 aldo/keto reductase [Bacillus pseudomycoides]
MKYRALGKTSLTVSEIGFSAWAIGGDEWGRVNDKHSISAMKKAIECGVNFIDTADVYGLGHSEKLVAQAIKEHRNDIILSTKGGLIGHHYDPDGEPVYDTAAKVIAVFETSLLRLQTDYIDVYFCHIWWDKKEETEAFLRAFEILKRDGKVRAVGVSTHDLQYIKNFNKDGQIDVIQLDYSILNREPENDILPYLQEKNLGAVIRGPLKMGILTGKFTDQTTFPHGDLRQDWPKETWFQDDLRKVEQLRSLSNPKQTLGQLALRYVLSHPAVSVAIPGAKTANQAAENVAASARPLLLEEELAYIRDF